MSFIIIIIWNEIADDAHNLCINCSVGARTKGNADNVSVGDATFD